MDVIGCHSFGMPSVFFEISLWNPEVVDERLRFAGFYQAGSVEVQGHLEGEHTTATDAWLRQLPPRAAERGTP